MAELFDPIALRSVSCRNRVWVSPMCQYSSDHGMPNDWHSLHLGSRAIGGAGLVMVEASAVCPEGRITAWDSGIWSDEHAQAFRRISSLLREHGAVPAIQLAHAGRKASTDVPWRGGRLVTEGPHAWQPVAPSPVPFHDGDPAPRALDREEIAGVVADFAAAAERARVAGFDVIELHFAHGYLVHQFLSPLVNERGDEYGGSFENRTRFALEIAAAVRKAWPSELPLLVRISATDWAEGGWDLPQSIELVKKLRDLGVDLVDCSSGGAVLKAKMEIGPGYQVPFARAIRAETGVATAAVGLITEAEQANQIVKSGSADAVLLARQMLRDPYWPLHAAQALGVDVPWPNQYLRAK